MGNVCARRTALSNAGGRLDYVDRDARKYKSTREDLLAVHDTAADLLGGKYWQTLAAEAQAAFAKAAPEQRTRIDRFGREISLKAREAHEIMLPLPNGVLERLTPAQVAKTVAEDFERYTGQPCHVALHWNARKTNLHVHILYAERKLLEVPEVKIAERNLFFDEQGRRRYKKKEILDDAGQLRPGCSIIRKGEVYEQHAFSGVDQKMGTRSWLADLKEKWALPLLNGPLHGDVELSMFDYSTGKLPLQHVGDVAHVDTDRARGSRAGIELDNELTREYNGMVDDGRILPRDAVEIQKAVLAAPKPERGKVLAQKLDEWEARQARREHRQRQVGGVSIPMPPLPPELKTPATQEAVPVAQAPPVDPSILIEQLRQAVLDETKRREQLLVERGLIGPRSQQQLADLIDKGKIPVLWLDGSKVNCTTFTTPELAVARSADTAEPFQAPAEPAHAGQEKDIQAAERPQADADPGRAASMGEYRNSIRDARAADRAGGVDRQPVQRKRGGKDISD